MNQQDWVEISKFIEHHMRDKVLGTHMKKIYATASLVTVTPEMASEWLADRWGEQRNIRAMHVEKLRIDMASDRFKISPDAILRVKGKLANGQHRLSAVVDHGKPVQFLVMESNDEELYKVIDSGLKRTAADALIGRPYAKMTPAIASVVMAYDRGSIPLDRARPGTQTEVINYCIENADMLQEAASFAGHLYNITKLLPMSIGGSLYVIGKRAGHEEKTKSFLEAVYTGSTNGTAGSAHEYRNRLIGNKGSKAKLGQGYLFALGLRALKAYIDGVRLGVLKWQKGDELPRI